MELECKFTDRVGHLITELRKTPLVRAINAFMASAPGVIFLALLTVIANIGEMEMFLYIFAVLYGLFVCILGDDFVTMSPFFIFCYIAPSRENNPGRNDQSIFSGGSGKLLILLIAMLLISLILRITFDPKFGWKRFLKQKRTLLWGILALGGAYLMSGLFSADYTADAVKNIGFALLQFASVFLIYFVLTGLVDWKTVRKDYLAWIGMLAGLVVAIEILNVYLVYNADFFMEGMISDRWQIYLGWGMHNNIGAMLALTIPFSLYLACRYRHGYLFLFASACNIAALVMTVSRMSILAGVAIFCVSFVVMLCKAKKRKVLGIVGGALLTVATTLIISFGSQLLHIFWDIFESGLLNDSGRGNLYIAGWNVFKANPIFGEGFYPSDMSTFSSAYWSIGEITSFLPPRWHNTLVQLLASCGLVGLIAYSFHRLQTMRVFLRNMNLTKTFIGFSVLAFLGMSLLDNHFFNLGPTLFYSMMLAFAEKSGECADTIKAHPTNEIGLQAEPACA